MLVEFIQSYSALGKKFVN